MKKVLCIAPHPDDETLGCGGTLLKHLSNDDHLYWLIITDMKADDGYSESQIQKKTLQINSVALHYSFKQVYNLRFSPGKIDNSSKIGLIQKISTIVNEIQPEICYVPYFGDAHSDHRIIFESFSACSKWFRYPSIKQILAYETVSETNFQLNPALNVFNPNLYVNISTFLDKKIEIANIYQSEMGKFPFPRSEEVLKALATLRGSESGFQAAESFIILKEIYE